MTEVIALSGLNVRIGGLLSRMTQELSEKPAHRWPGERQEQLGLSLIL